MHSSIGRGAFWCLSIPLFVAACSGSDGTTTTGETGGTGSGGGASVGGGSAVAGNTTGTGGGSLGAGGLVGRGGSGAGGVSSGRGGSPGVGGSNPGLGGGGPGVGGHLNAGGSGSGVGGHPSVGGVGPGAGGDVSVGGDLGAGGNEPGAGGNDPGAGGNPGAGGDDPGVGGRTGTEGGSPAVGGTGGDGTGGVTASGGNPGVGGGNGSMCPTAFFSADAAAVNPAEYAEWKRCWVKTVASGAMVVINNGSCGQGQWVVSEGIGYGMLLAVANDDQASVDGFWQFYQEHWDKDRHLMNWSLETPEAAGTDNDANAATDGDLDVAMGLLQANMKWGGYLEDALALINNIRLYETEVCDGKNILRPGDKFGGCSDNGKMNPSYFAPGYYRVFATVDTANADYWTKMADDTYPFLSTYQAAMNGLVPNWSYLDGNTEATYGYDAARTPWRVAVDYAWFCTPAAQTFLNNVVTYVDGNGGIAGVPFDKNSVFLGAFALSAMATSQEKLDAYVPLWLSTATAADTSYFNQSLRLLYALVGGNQFPSTL